jgi:hypothetical protein
VWIIRDLLNDSVKVVQQVDGKAWGKVLVEVERLKELALDRTCE